LNEIKIELKERNISFIADKCGLTIATSGWTVPISPSDATAYADDFDLNDNSNNKENHGFFMDSSGVVLTHKDAKIRFSKEDAHTLIEFINEARIMWQVRTRQRLTLFFRRGLLHFACFDREALQ